MTGRRFAILKVALRLYQLEHGRPAPDLASLVPAYVPVLPLDPYTQAAFGYRLSDGEPQPPPPRRGPPGRFASGPTASRATWNPWVSRRNRGTPLSGRPARTGGTTGAAGRSPP